MALKAEAAQSPMETNAAIASFYRHRLLCRIFLDSKGEFVLKGGQNMLARTIDARATRDIDLLAHEASLDFALQRLAELASSDLGDFFSFELASSSPIKANDECRDGLCATFDAMLGTKRVCKISVDLVVDETFNGEPDHISPKDRIELEGILTCSYPAYPVANAIADKVCATLKLYNGRPSSRVKDLIDLLVYANAEPLDGTDACAILARELRIRKVEATNRFTIPDVWFTSYQSVYKKLAAQANMNSKYPDLATAESAVQAFIDPLMGMQAMGMKWIPSETRWNAKSHGNDRNE